MHCADYKTILSPKNGMNLYRGYTQGCIYCDSRSTCYQIGHDFGDIEVKRNAPLILEEQLRRKRKACMDWYRGYLRPIYHFIMLLLQKLPSLQGDDLSEGILETVDFESYRAEVQTMIDISLADEDAEADPLPVSTYVGIPIPVMKHS